MTRTRLGTLDAGAAASVAGLGLVLLVAAILFDAEALYVPGLALLGLVGVAAAWVALGAAGSGASRQMDARRVMESEPLHATLEVRGGALGLLGAVLEDPVMGDDRPLRLGTRRARVKVTARFGRRGRRELPAPILVIGDPLGLITLRRPAQQADASLLVLPRLEPVRAARHAAGEGTGIGGRRSASGAAEVELAGLRPAQAGTSATRIHWPALARGAGLLERKLLPESDARPLVVLDPRGSVSADELDAAVRATASLTVHLARHGGCALLLPGDRRATALDSELHGWTALHVRLALLDGEGGPPLSALNGRRGPVVLVVARPPERVPRALIAAPAARRVLVVPGTMAGRRASFTVAGCTGYELGRAQGGEVAA